MTLLIQSQQQKFVRKWELSESSRRSVAKTISWRVTGSLSTFLISFILLGDFVVAGSIAMVQITVNTVLYFIHERVWNKIKWGRENV